MLEIILSWRQHSKSQLLQHHNKTTKLPVKSCKEDRLSSCQSLFMLYPRHGGRLTRENHGLYFSSFSVYTREWIVFCLTVYSWFVFKLGINKSFHYTSAKATDGKKRFNTEMSTILEFQHSKHHVSHGNHAYLYAVII